MFVVHTGIAAVIVSGMLLAGAIAAGLILLLVLSSPFLFRKIRRKYEHMDWLYDLGLYETGNIIHSVDMMKKAGLGNDCEWE